MCFYEKEFIFLFVLLSSSENEINYINFLKNLKQEDRHTWHKRASEKKGVKSIIGKENKNKNLTDNT